MWKLLCPDKLPLWRNVEPLMQKEYYTHLWRNAEPLMPLLLNVETFMPRQFTPVTKCGAPYAKKYCTHLWRNAEPLMLLLLNEEILMPRQFTPVTKCGAPYAISRNLERSSPLWLKSLFTKWGTPKKLRKKRIKDQFCMGESSHFTD